MGAHCAVGYNMFELCRTLTAAAHPSELHGKGDVGEDEVERRLRVLAV